MVGRLTLLLLGLLAMTTIVLAQSSRGVDEEIPGSLIDIDTELGKEKEEVPEESGSGKDGDDEDDEDLDKSSGSGSGAYTTDEVSEVKVTTTVRTLTPCQNLYESSKHLFGNFIPKCDENGDYAAMQCRGHASTGTCWCADRQGADIPGTYVQGPTQLDCESGKNLKPCLFRLVNAIRNPAYGTYRPRCQISGDFHARQCQGSICFCVDDRGDKIYGTERSIESSENMCDAEPTDPVLIIPDKGITVKSEKTHPTKPVDPVYTIPSKTPNVNVEPPQTDDEDESTETDSPNNTGEEDDGDDIKKEGKLHSGHIMTQPGLLAAIIGGAVVGLLCAILLVMFIVYRMRKKDEGSYALDEPRKKSTYSPINQSDKEYYA